ncbi:MAG: cytochrome c family protein [Pseudomonadota bacterium]
MDSFEFNKIAGAVLAALLLVFGTRTLINEIRHDKPLEQQALVVEIPDEAPAGEPEPAEETVDIATLIPAASVEGGEKLFKRCVACHTNSAGAPHRVGPNLHAVADRDIGSAAGFSYSKALSEKDGTWDVSALDGFLLNPKKWAPGTKMAYAGLKKPNQRADMIKYLQSLK